MKRTQSQNQTCKLSYTDMWSLRHNEIDGGIEGYNVPKEVYDHKEIKWKKERAAILKDPSKHRKDPKLDDAGNPLPPPKRPNFLDEVTKWANSYYDKEKAEKTLEDCEGKGHALLAPYKPKETQAFYSERPNFFDKLKSDEEKKYKQLEEREDLINDIKEKTKEWEKLNKKTFFEKTKSNYSAKTEDGKLIKTTFGKSLRATLVTEAEHLGEKNPFYNTYKNPDEDEGPKKKELFFPGVSYFLIKKLLKIQLNYNFFLFSKLEIDLDKIPKMEFSKKQNCRGRTSC